MMRAVVFVSTVQNPEEPLVCSGSFLEPVQENIIINDFDLIAVEAAVSLKEAGFLDEVVVFSLSGDKSHLLKVLAMGADRAVWGACENRFLTPERVVATALSHFGASPAIWMTGKLGVNFERHVTGQLLAAHLGCPCFSSASKISKSGDLWSIVCEDDGGEYRYESVPPFVVTSELRLAEPRYPGLPSIIKARRKPIEEIAVVEAESMLKTVSVREGDVRRRVCRFITKEALLEIL